MNPEQSQRQQQKKKRRKSSNSDGIKSYARYTGLALQMVAIIVIMTFAGVKLDERRASETPVFTLILSLLGVFAGIYIAIKDFIGKK